MRYRFFFKLMALFSRKPKYALMAEEPDIRRTDLQKIRIPVYLTAGEKDMIREPHTKFIAENIKNSRLRILEGETHSSYVMDSEKLLPIIKEGAAYIRGL